MPNPEGYLRKHFMKTSYRETFCEKGNVIARRVGLKSYNLLKEQSLKELGYENLLQSDLEKRVELWAKTETDERYLSFVMEAIRALKARMRMYQTKSEFQENYCTFKSNKGKPKRTVI